VFWIITQQDLWESPSPNDPLKRYKASLYSVSTVWSLIIGAVISYVLLFVDLLLAAAFTIDDALLALTLQRPGLFGTLWKSPG
jgi:hypothetical protein